LEISSRLLLCDGKPVGVQGIARDITLRKQAEEASRETDRRKDEFLAMLGHELRNPLAPIRNAVRVLREQPAPDPAAVQMHDMIDRQVRQLTRLVDDLLDMSRINRGLVELRKEPVALSEVVARAIETTRPLFDERQHRLEVSLPSEPLTMDADPARLEQMLSNLLNNAARYTEPGGCVWLAVACEGGDAVLRVQDTGIGIRPELVPHLFDLFTQGDRVSGAASEGLGIGLTLVRRLAEMHGGSVSASSPGPGQGSAFVVRLPLRVEEPTLALPEQATPEAAPAKSRRVLVVDDNIDAAVSLALVLRVAGHEVALAHDGPSALAVAGQQRFEAIFLDIGLPKGMDGYEVARRLREDIGLQGTMLAALTGYGQQEDRTHSQAAGFDYHFVKPVDTDVLIDVLASLGAEA
jgi:CheY-like chemotaxis protein